MLPQLRPHQPPAQPRQPPKPHRLERLSPYAQRMLLMVGASAQRSAAALLNMQRRVPRQRVLELLCAAQRSAACPAGAALP